MEKEKAVIYSRVSTPTQDFSRQTDELRAEAELRKLDLVGVFEETASGYMDVQRPELERMKKVVVEEGVKTVLTWEVSRISRRAHKTLKELEFFLEHDINIVFLSQKYELSIESHFSIIAMAAALAQSERNQFIERSRSGMIKKAVEGKAHGFGVMPYGFTKGENKKLIVLEDEARYVRMMYDLRIRGKSMGEIAYWLNSIPVETRRKKNKQLGRGRNNPEIEYEFKWRKNTVSKILKSELYKGKRLYRGAEIAVASIIDFDIWDKVQKTFTDPLLKNVGRQTSDARAKYKYLFKGKISCGICKRAYLTRTDKSTSGLYFSIYWDSGRKNPGFPCNNGQFKAQVLDKFLWAMLSLQTEYIRKIKTEAISELNIDELKSKIKTLKKQLSDSLTERSNWLRHQARGRCTEAELDKELDRLGNEDRKNKSELESAQNNLTRSNRAINEIGEIKKPKNVRQSLQKKEYVDRWVDRVYLYKINKWGFKWSDLREEFHHIDSPHREPHGNDQVMYVEMFAFGFERPIKAIMTSVSELFFMSENLKYFEGSISLD